MEEYQTNLFGLGLSAMLKTADIILTAIFLSGNFTELNPLGFNWVSILLGYLPLILFVFIVFWCRYDRLVQKSMFIGILAYMVLGGVIMGYHLQLIGVVL